jgi:small-conductance mechanosensitive channel
LESRCETFFDACRGKRSQGTAVAGNESYYARAERRIEYVTLGIGAAGTTVALFGGGVRAAAGVAVGAVLAWLNYRWLKQGVGALVGLAKVQEGAAKVRVPRNVYFKFIGRYVLLILAAYVILTRLHVPAVSLLAGFGALVLAVLAEIVWQLLGTNGPRF